MSTIDRRSLLARGAAAAGGAVLGSTLFQTLNDAAGATSPPRGAGGHGHGGGHVRGSYGRLAPVPDQNGDTILALPDGFEYVTFSKAGDPMADGTPTPTIHDGMAAFSARGGKTLLIRNHELRTAPGTVDGTVQGPAELRWDELAGGGTTSVLFDTRRGRVVHDGVSLSGTLVNCAGGVAYRDAGWITCEETVVGPAQGYAQKHGYTYLVPASADGAVEAVPFPAMGRFAHEAVATDPRTGEVYETEDDGNDSGFYRFVPRHARDLRRGGRLQMLGIAGRPGYSTLTGQRVGRRLPVTWIDIPDPDPDLEGGATAVALQGIAGGAALFNRLEGIWYDRRSAGFFFTSTSGGDAQYGQVWHYSPRRRELTLFFESPGGSVLDSPDNLLVTPRGGIVLCEDDASGDDDTHPLAPGITDVNRLIGLSRHGEAFELAVNVFSASEFCGATFSPDGRTLFVNIQGGSEPGSGMTCAITGPWHRGAL